MTTKPKPRRKAMTYHPATATTPEYVTDGKTNYYAGTPIRMPPATREIRPYTGPESAKVQVTTVTAPK